MAEMIRKLSVPINSAYRVLNKYHSIEAEDIAMSSTSQKKKAPSPWQIPSGGTFASLTCAGSSKIILLKAYPLCPKESFLQKAFHLHSSPCAI